MSEALVGKFYAYLLTQKRVSHNTYSSYKSDLDQFFSFLQEREISLDKASREHVKEFLATLTAQSISPRSRSRKLSCLKTFYGWLQRVHGWENITLDVAFPRLEKKLPTVLTEEQIKRLLEATDQDTSVLGKRNQMLFYLLYATGMRVSELVQTRVSNIQLDSGILTVKGKGGKERVIPIPQQISAMLDTYLKDTWPHLCRHVLRNQSHDYLFPVVYDKHIKPMSRQICWLMLKQFCKIADVPLHISPHHVRHSLATHLLKKGADLRSLQMLLGHETISTVELYTHLETDHLRKIYNKKHPRA